MTDTNAENSSTPLTLYRKILILSYYHPWFAGGGHRPRRLMTEELAKDREVCFLFVDTDGVEDFSVRKLEEPNASKLLLARSCSDEYVTFLEQDQAEMSAIPVASLLDDFKPEIVRIHNPSSIHMLLVDICRSRGVIVHYDIMDDWDSFSRQPWGVNTSDWFIKNSNIRTCVSQFISDQAPSESIKVIPNAITGKFIANCRNKPALCVDSERPTVIYVGALWPDWIDWELLGRMVRELPAIDFIFIGALTGPVNECHATGAAKRSATAMPNARFISEIDHCAMVPFLQGATIGIIPFIRNRLTLAASPLKAFDYLAADLQIVSSDLPELNSYPGVYCSIDHDAFISKVSELCFSPVTPDLLRGMRHFIDASTWLDRLYKIEQLVERHKMLGSDVR